MKIHRLETEQILPIDLGEAWEFFSTPKNLDTITPEDMSFEIKSGAEKQAYAGQLITYKIKPIFNISMNWVTEITHCVEGEYFIDEQRFGPYRFWHHQHHFQHVENGVLMKDILHYALPFGILGEVMGSIMIHQKIENIFDFRKRKLEETFYVAKKKAIA